MTFEKYLKINNFKDRVMNDDSFRYTWDREYQIRKKFNKDYLKYLKNFKYTKFSRIEIMEI